MKKTILLITTILIILSVTIIGCTKTQTKTCPELSCDVGTCCGSIRQGIETEGVIVPASCPCPSDTVKKGEDTVTEGGPYLICGCK